MVKLPVSPAGLAGSPVLMVKLPVSPAGLAGSPHVNEFLELFVNSAHITRDSQDRL